MATKTDYVLIRLRDEQVVKIVPELPARIFLPDVPFRADFSAPASCGEYELRERVTDIPEPTLAQLKVQAHNMIDNHTPTQWIKTKTEAHAAIDTATTKIQLRDLKERIDWKNLA
jgi:hypothetical protein